MSDIEIPTVLGEHADALGRALLAHIAPYLRPWDRGNELAGPTSPLLLDPSWVVGVHIGGPAGAMTIGDRTHDTGIPLALLDAIAPADLPA